MFPAAAQEAWSQNNDVLQLVRSYPIFGGKKYIWPHFVVSVILSVSKFHRYETHKYLVRLFSFDLSALEKKDDDLIQRCEKTGKYDAKERLVVYCTARLNKICCGEDIFFISFSIPNLKMSRRKQIF